VAPNRNISEALIIIYRAFDLTPNDLNDQIKDYTSEDIKYWDRFSYFQLTIAEELLGLKRDSLYSIFKNVRE
jgi:hypothetical protein